MTSVATSRTETALRRILFILAGLLLAAACATSASAITRSFINCPDGVPCEASLSAHIDTVGKAHLPWVIALPTPAGLCLVLVDQGSDGNLLVSVVEPNGLVSRFPVQMGIPYRLVPKTVAGWQTIEVDSAPPMGEQIAGYLTFKLLAASDCQ